MYSTLTNASASAWGLTQDAFAKFAALSPDSPKEYQAALMDLNLKMQIAATVEQKTAAAIDKAFQAHSAVASK